VSINSDVENTTSNSVADIYEERDKDMGMVYTMPAGPTATTLSVKNSMA
jgi:hypothetical protein